MWRKQFPLMVFAVVLAAVAHITSLSAQNLLYNGSFEIGSSGYPDQPAGWLTYRVGTSTDSRRTTEFSTDGDWSLYLSAESADSNRHQWIHKYQANTFVGERLQLDVRFDALVDLAQGGTASATFELRNNFRRDPVIDTRTLILPDTGGRFDHFDLGTFYVPPFSDFPNDRYLVYIFFRADADGTDAFQGAEFYIDNVVVNAIPVPEPTALGVAGLWALLGLIARRRGNR